MRCAPYSSTLKQLSTASVILDLLPCKYHVCNLCSTGIESSHLEHLRGARGKRTRCNHVRSCGDGPRSH